MENNKTKSILCFGDSNVYGYNPQNGTRYFHNQRWTGILQEFCQNKYKIIEAGANNRTAFSDNPAGKMLTGYKILPEILNNEYDIVILAIGINDLQIQYQNTLNDFKIGITRLINLVKKSNSKTQIILVAPSFITATIKNNFFATLFDEDSIKKSHTLPKIYEQVAKENNCLYINLNNIVQTSNKDGLHYEVETHKQIAVKIFDLITKL